MLAQNSQGHNLDENTTAIRDVLPLHSNEISWSGVDYFSVSITPDHVSLSGYRSKTKKKITGFQRRPCPASDTSFRATGNLHNAWEFNVSLASLPQR